MVDRKLVGAPSDFIAGRPKAALLFWFFGDFGCGALLFVVVLVVCGYGGGWGSLLGVRLAGGRLCGRLLFAWLSLVVSVVVAFSHGMSWVGSWAWLSQFLGGSLPALAYLFNCTTIGRASN